MNSFFPLIFYLAAACLLMPLGSHTRAETVKSPLTVLADPIGADLQKIFISAPPEIADKTPASFIAYRKTITLPATPQAAILHIFADVRYLLWINGQPVHRGPNRFDWHGPQYDSVNVASALRAGANTFAIVVMGNGSNARMMKHAPGLTLRPDADGRTVLETNETWKRNAQTRYQPAKVDWAKIVDRIDACVEDGDWTLPEYDDLQWKSAVKVSGDQWGPLIARRIPLLRDTPLAPQFAGDAQFPAAHTDEDRAKAAGHGKGMKLNVENNLIEPTMFPALWALDQEIVPAERRARVTDYLFKNREQANRIMMFYYLQKQMVLADDNAFDTEILNSYRTKWKPQVEARWQTTWEEFDGGSRAHYYGMFPGYFLSATSWACARNFRFRRNAS